MGDDRRAGGGVKKFYAEHGADGNGASGLIAVSRAQVRCPLMRRNGQPRQEVFPAGAVVGGAAVEFGKGTCKPNSVVCGHSSRRRVTADAHQRPTRRFRQRSLRSDFREPPERIGPIRNAAWLLANASLPIWSCSVWGLPCPRRYRRSGALLPHHFTLTPAGLAVQANLKGHSGGPPERGVAEAVFFLWHWPSVRLKAHIPDVIRHTALRSSDFPPPADLACARLPAATARSSCLWLV